MLLIWSSSTNDIGGNSGALGLACYWEGEAFCLTVSNLVTLGERAEIPCSHFY